MKKKLLTILTAGCMIAVGMAFTACENILQSGSGSSETPSSVFEEVTEITEVTMIYNGEKVTSGLIEVDLTAGSITLSAEVKTVGSPDYTVQYESSNSNVAEVGADGLITLKAEGETVITATAGEKSHQIVLVVSNQYIESVSYIVTVEGGYADVEQAKAGEHVFLQAALEELETDHKEFLYWEYLSADTMMPLEGLWVNGNSFRMPEQAVYVRAVCKEMLYTLNVENGTIKSAVKDGEELSPIAEQVNGLNVYKIPYATEVTVEANAEEADRMFVGWDYAARKNRVATAAQREYSFVMSDITTSVFAEFSKTSALTFGSATFVDKDNTETITGGKIGNSSEPDETLQGMSGYRFHFPENKGGSAQPVYNENLTAVDHFSTLVHGSQTVKVLVRNNASVAMTLEFYATSYSTLATTGEFTVAPNEIKTVYMIASAGFHNPAFGLMLRESLAGSAQTKSSLDIVYQTADTFADGDPQFVVPNAQYVTLESRVPNGPDYPANSGIRNDCYLNGPNGGGDPTKPTGVSFGGRKNVNNKTGITNIVSREDYISYSGTPYLSAKLSNLPAFDPENPELTVYYRIINTNGNAGRFIFGLGNKENPVTDPAKTYYDIRLEGNSTILFGLTVTRQSADEDIYFTVMKPAKESSVSRYDYNMIIQMLYNNEIGVEDENIFISDYDPSLDIHCEHSYLGELDYSGEYGSWQTCSKCGVKTWVQLATAVTKGQYDKTTSNGPYEYVLKEGGDPTKASDYEKKDTRVNLSSTSFMLNSADSVDYVFKVTADEAGKAKVIVRMRNTNSSGGANVAFQLNKTLSVYVGSVASENKVAIADSVILNYAPEFSGGAAFYEYELCLIDLQAGENTIILRFTDGGRDASGKPSGGYLQYVRIETLPAKTKE